MAGIELIQNSTITGTLTVSGDTTIAADVFITAGALSITGDGSNAVTLTESGAGDFTIDAPDDIRLDAGGNDIVLRASGTEFGRLKNDSSHFILEASAADKDIILRGTDNTTEIDALRLDMSEAGAATFIDDVYLKDDKDLIFGDATDFKIYHNSTTNLNHVSSLLDRQLSLNGNIIRLTNQANDTNYLSLESTGATFADAVNIGASKKIYLGGSDARMHIYHTGSGGAATVLTKEGHLNLVNQSHGSDIIFKTEDSGGSVKTPTQIGAGGNITIAGSLLASVDSTYDIGATGSRWANLWVDSINGGTPATGDYLPLAGGTMTGDVIYNDSVKIKLGTGGGNSDIYHNGTDMYIRQLTAAGDLNFAADSTGSGGASTAYFALDGGTVLTRFYKGVNFNDSVTLSFGNVTDKDLRIYHNTTDSHIDNYTGNLNIVNNADNKDINFYSDNGSGSVAVYFYLDGSAVNGSTVLGATKFPDKSKIYMGSDYDLELFHDGTNTYIENYTGSFFISQLLDGGDLVLQCDDGGGGSTAYLTLDGGAGYTIATKDIRFDDSVSAAFGTGIDAFINHSGSAFNIYNDIGAMNFIQRQDDGNMVFQSDDGSEGTATYFSLDGGSSATNELYTKWPDYSRIALGSGKDLLLYHDASHSYIQEVGTGDLRIEGDSVWIREADGTNQISAYQGTAKLYKDGTTRLETTSGGITVSGVVTATGGTSTEWNTAYDNHITGI